MNNYRIKTINLLPNIGDFKNARLQDVEIPAEIKENSKEEWEYICSLIDMNGKDEPIAEWVA